MPGIDTLSASWDGRTPGIGRSALTAPQKTSTRYKQTGSLLRGGRGLGRRDDRGQEVERVRARGRRRRRARAALPARRVPLQAPRVDDVAAGQRVEQLEGSEDAPHKNAAKKRRQKTPKTGFEPDFSPRSGLLARLRHNY